MFSLLLGEMANIGYGLAAIWYVIENSYIKIVEWIRMNFAFSAKELQSWICEMLNYDDCLCFQIL